MKVNVERLLKELRQNVRRLSRRLCFAEARFYRAQIECQNLSERLKDARDEEMRAGWKAVCQLHIGRTK